jgi:hypothetical protein
MRRGEEKTSMMALGTSERATGDFYDEEGAKETGLRQRKSRLAAPSSMQQSVIRILCLPPVVAVFALPAARMFID